MNLLEARDLSHSFDYKLFFDINLSLAQKESCAIIGVSGSGKSTLMHILSSLLKPQDGVVNINKKDIYSLADKEMINLRKNTLGLIFQQHYLFKGFSAYENLELASILTKNDIDKELLKELGIDFVIDQKVTHLSGGQQQRVSIARVLTKKPDIIFADEPTGNLDKQYASEVIDIFFKYINDHNAALLMATHDEDLAFRCDKVYRLENYNLTKVK